MIIQKLILSSFLLLASCATPLASRLVDLDYSLITIQQGIKKAFPVDFQNVSRDGRYFESYPFVRNGRHLIPASSETERGRAKIEIRGVARPYTIEVSIEVEEASSPNYVDKDFRVIGYDDVVARIFLARLKAYLHKSNKEGNVIDDFRVY